MSGATAWGRDLGAGLAIAGLLLPEAVAYAGLAGLDPAHGLAAAIAGCFAYGLFGRSRFAIVAPTSSSAVILAAILADPALSAAEKSTLAVIATGLVGLLFLGASLLRLGALDSFIARPVLRGFAFALALSIIIRQLPSLAGISVTARDPFHILAETLRRLSEGNGPSLAVGAAALAALVMSRRFPRLPGAALVLAAAIVANLLFDLEAHGVAAVGRIDLAFMLPALPDFAVADLPHVVRLCLPLVLILFAESWGTVRSLSLRRGDAVDADRELRALGLANLASALVRGMPVGAGFSAGSASEAAGAASRFAALSAAVLLALLVAFGLGLVARLPEPVLAAVVIAALLHALDPTPFLQLNRVDRDQYLAVIAALGVFLSGILNGMLIAIALSFLLLVRRLSSRHVIVLGRLAGGHDFVDIDRHPDAAPVADIVILRPAQPLFFGNADPVLGEVARKARLAGAARGIVVSLEETFDLDSTALDALQEFDAAMRRSGRDVVYARVHDRVRDLLSAAGAGDMATRSAFSVDDAVALLSKRLGRGEKSV